MWSFVTGFQFYTLMTLTVTLAINSDACQNGYCHETNTKRDTQELFIKNTVMPNYVDVCDESHPTCLRENVALNKPAYQTGLFGRSEAKRAVDGILDKDGNANYSHTACAHSDIVAYGNGSAQWWVDLLATYRIFSVTLFNTYFVGAYRRMNNFIVEVVRADESTGQSCGVYRQPEPVSRGGNYTFYCNYTVGRFVFVRKLKGSKEQQFMTLCEVVVKGDLMATPNTAGTTYLRAIFHPGKETLLDGVMPSAFLRLSDPTKLYPEDESENVINTRYKRDTSSSYLPKACINPNVASLSNSTNNTWWLDLNDTYSIRTVTVYDMHWSKSYWAVDAFNIYVITSDKSKKKICAVYDNPRPGSAVARYVYKCNNLRGRYVYIRKVGDSEQHQQQSGDICEVIIDLVPAKEVATTASPSRATTAVIMRGITHLAIAHQRGTHGGATADKAIDGQLDDDACASTYLSACAYISTVNVDNTAAEWWLDLRALYSVTTITVYNTYNKEIFWRLNDFTAEVFDLDDRARQSCGVYSKPEPVSRGGSYTFYCNNKIGRFVFVRRLQGSRDQQFMTLCEVVVEGSVAKPKTTPAVTSVATTTPVMMTTTPPTTTTELFVMNGVSESFLVTVAYEQRAHQLGTRYGASAAKAIDGIYDADTGDDYYLTVCAYVSTVSAGNGPATWWLDLEAFYSVTRVKVYNTYNIESYWRLNNFTVEVVSSDKKTTHVCGVYSKPEPVPRGGSYTFNCSNASGKYVYIKRIEGSRDEQYMTLCEVKIDGYVKATTPFVQPATPALYNLEDGGLSSIAQKFFTNPAYQIGSYLGASATNAIDGRLDRDTGTSYYLHVCAYVVTFLADGGPALWWLDMDNDHAVEAVTVFNTYRKEIYWRLNNFTVEVVASDNKTREICGVYSKADPVGPGRSYSFDCRSKVGRFVYIRRLRGSVHEQVMTLCEVIIDGYPVSSAPLAEIEQRLPRPPNPANSVSTMLSPTALSWTLCYLLFWF